MWTPQWLAACRHRIRGVGAPCLLVLQHHIVLGQSRIVAPVVLVDRRPSNLLAPHLIVAGTTYRAMLLSMTSSPLALLMEASESVDVREDAVTAGLDAIFRGYPVGIPFT